MPKKERPIEMPCSGGCGKTVRIRPSKIRKADYYVCNRDCENCLPAPAPGLVKEVQLNAAAGFRGISYMTPAQQQAIRLAAEISWCDEEEEDADADAYEQVACPFCETVLDWTRHDKCPSCSALIIFDDDQIVDCRLDRMTSEKLSALLVNIDTCYAETSDPDLLWLQLPDIRDGAELDAARRQVKVPVTGDTPVTINVPFLIVEDVDPPERQRLLDAAEITVEDLASVEENLIRSPTCTYCTHALCIGNDDHGLETEHYCAWPLMGREIADHLDGYQEGSTLSAEIGFTSDRFKNLLLEKFLERHMEQVDDGPLFGFAEGCLQHWHAPICPGFELDRDHADVIAGPYFAAKATVPIQFFSKSKKSK